MLRFSRNLIIRPESLGPVDGSNINGPSLINAPAWLPNRLGRFYLYFAHHHGGYIRLAYADALDGPWRIHQPGSLKLADAVGCQGHIASPDVHVDHVRREIHMYFHGVVRNGGGRQLSFVATSPDGLDFVARPAPIAEAYLRAAPWRDRWIGIASRGPMYLAKEGFEDFRLLPQTVVGLGDPALQIRHAALRVVGDDLQVYFTCIGDRPERIMRAHVDLRPPPEEWRARDASLVLAPEAPWEGADEPLAASKTGAAAGRENALRDPAIFEHEGRTYLLYAVGGESGIALADITEPDPAPASPTPRSRPPQATTPTHQARLDRLAQPGALEARLAELDQDRPLNRLFVMGCGRSGTWLLTLVMTTFRDTAVLSKEVQVEHFGLVETNASALVLKRKWNSYATVENIPKQIGIAYIVRHPYDVLTSHNPVTKRAYHTRPDRWRGEMEALRYLIDAGREKTKIVRYEDLVRDSDAVQGSLGSFFGLEVASSVSDIAGNTNVPPEMAAAMHGVRPINGQSVNRYRANPEQLDHLREIRPQLGDTLDWVAETFGYDLSL